MHVGAAAARLPAAPVPGRARPFPVLDAGLSHLPKLTLQDAHAMVLTPTLDALLTAVRTGAISAKPLGQEGHLPAVSEHPAQAVHMYPYAFTGTAGVYDASSNTDTAGTFYIDGSNVLLVGSETFGGVTLSVANITAAGLHGANLACNFAAGTHLISIALQLQVAPHTTRLGATGLDAGLPTNTFWAVGVLVGVTALRTVTDIGPYRGLDLEKLAAARGVELQQEVLHRLDVTHLKGASLNFRGGGGSFTIAALFRLDLVGSRQMTWRRLCTAAVAREVIFEAKSRRLWPKDKLRALSWVRELVPVPPLKDPSAVVVGDEVVHLKSASVAPSFILGNLAVFVGAQFFWRRDFEVSRHRLDESHLEITVNPTRVRTLGVFISSPFGPVIDLGRDRATSARQNLTLDMRTEGAQIAYPALVANKKLAIPFTTGPLNRTSLQAPARMTAKIRAAAPGLPEGVTRNYVHLILSREIRLGAAIELRLFPEVIVPRGWVMAWGRRCSLIHERQLVSDGARSTVADVRARRLQSDRLFAGQLTTEAAGQLRWHQGAHEQSDSGMICFEGFNWRLQRQLNGARKGAVDSCLVRPLTARFGLNLRPTLCPGQRQNRTVTLEQTCRLEDLGPAPDDPSHFAYWMHAGEEAKIRQRRVLALRRKLHEEPTQRAACNPRKPESHALFADRRARQGQVVQKFLVKQGEAGCALLNKLSGQAAPLHLTSTSSSADAALTATQRCVLKYEATALPVAHPAAVWARFCAVVAAQKSVVVARIEAELDPFAPQPAANPLHERLVSAEAQLATLLTLPEGEYGTLAPALYACARAQNRLFWERGGARLQKALSGWLTPSTAVWQQAWTVQQTYQGTPLPTAYPALAERWGHLWPAVQALDTRLAWLNQADVPMPRGQRQAQTRRAQTLRDALQGRGSIGGLMPLATLSPHTRQEIRRAGRRASFRAALATGKNCTQLGLGRRAHAALMDDLDRLGEACSF